MKCFCQLLALFLVCFYCVLIRNQVTSQTSSNIPEILQACYRRNFTTVSRPPLTLSLLLELLRKVETDPKNSLNMRILTSSMLHGVQFDGIMRTSENYSDDNLAIPYRAILNKFFKYKIVVDYLTPGRVSQFPVDSLSTHELCFLHSLISNTVDPRNRGDEASTCNDPTLMPIETSLTWTDEASRCPIKLGNIKTKYGPVSAGHLISGIASGLQLNDVSFQRVFEAIYETMDETNASINTNAAMAFLQNNQVDNIWVATIAGDLAEAVLNQASEKPVLGTAGFWNNTLLPHVFYLKSLNWDLTEAEILAGIDAAILGKKVRNLLQVLDSTRLSQVLDMYYSDRGIPYNFDFNVRNRTHTLQYLLGDTNLEKQIIGSAKLLQTIGGKYESTLTDNDIKELAIIYTDEFQTRAESLTSTYDKTELIKGKNLIANLELILIIDGTYSAYESQQFIYTLIEQMEVSYYGSKIGIINGQTGHWMTNITGEIFEIFRSLHQQELQWPATLSLGRSLESVIGYYQNKSHTDCFERTLRPVGQVILVLDSSNGRLTSSDLTRTRNALNSIKSTYPQTKVIVVSGDIIGQLRQIIIDDDDEILEPSSDVISMVSKINDRISKVPASIVKFYCNSSQVYFEDYVTPGRENVYQIHREFVKRGYFVTKFGNSAYGELTICALTSRTAPANRRCKGLTVNDEISFNSRDFCSATTPCDIQYAVTVNNTLLKCAENDCRYPDQVRFNIRYTYTSSGFTFGSTPLALVTYILYQFIYYLN